MQYRSPVGLGPSSKTWPRWEPQFAHATSVRRMNRVRSSISRRLPVPIGAEKLGQPVPESNLALEAKRSFPQIRQT